MFFAQLRSVSNHHIHSQDVIHNIIHLPLYEPICKFFNRNPDFQAYISTSAQAIAEKKICKLTFNTVLRLLIKAIDLICLETFNMIAVDKKN